MSGDPHTAAGELFQALMVILIHGQGRCVLEACCDVEWQLQEVVKAELLDRGDPASALVDFDKTLRFKKKTT